MDDDLNTPDALAALFDLVKEINTLSASSTREALETAAGVFDELAGVLGLLYNRKKDEVPARRDGTGGEACRRQEGQRWATADALRAEITQGAGPSRTPPGSPAEPDLSWKRKDGIIPSLTESALCCRIRAGHAPTSPAFVRRDIMLRENGSPHWRLQPLWPAQRLCRQLQRAPLRLLPRLWRRTTHWLPSASRPPTMPSMARRSM